MSNPVPVPPRIALFDPNHLYTWSDGTNFSGFLLINLIPAETGGINWVASDYGNSYPGVSLPIYQRVPIVNGTVNNSLGLFLNADITPPGTKYRCYFYDATGTQIAGPTSNFTVTTTAAFTPPLLTLTVPAGPGTGANPDS